MLVLQKILCICGFLLATVACTDNESLSVQTLNKESAPQSENFQRSEQEALQVAQSFFKDSQTNTRAGAASTLTVEARTPYSAIKTRANASSTAVDTTLYFINRGEDNGFVIVSGDKRHSAIVAYSTKGKLPKKHVTDNPSLKDYVESYEKYISFEYDSATLAYDREMREKWGDAWQFKLMPLHPDSLKIEGVPDLPYGYPKTYKKETHSPFGYTLNWGQKKPYNLEIPPINDTIPPAGCAVTAMAQVLALYKQPQTIGELQLHWEDIYAEGGDSGKLGKHPTERNARVTNEVSHLYKLIADLAWTRYTTTAGGTQPYMIRPTMQRLGFSCSEPHSVEGKELVDELKSRRPIIMIGYTSGLRKGHAWIIDGYEVTTTENYISHSATYLKLLISDRYYFHCNWGWDGDGTNGSKGNGYFSLEHLAPWTYIDKNDKGKGRKEKAHFVSDISCFTNIKYVGNE